MDEIMLTIERHEEKIKNLSKDIAVLREVQSEIKAMNETLVILAAEIKHTNEHLGSMRKSLMKSKECLSRDCNRLLLP